MRHLSYVVAIFAASALVASCKSSKQDPVVEVASSDPEMNAARAEAKRRFPELVKAFEGRKEGDIFSVKYPFPTTGGGVEHIWLTVTSIGPDAVSGRIDNAPVAPIGHKLGDAVTVPSRDISDWLYRLAGSKEVVGGFSVKLLLDRENKK